MTHSVNRPVILGQWAECIHAAAPSPSRFCRTQEDGRDTASAFRPELTPLVPGRGGSAQPKVSLNQR